MAADLARLRNDLEPAATALRPVIADVLVALAATRLHVGADERLGRDLFGLFADRTAARRAVNGLRRTGWWCWSGSLLRG